MSVFIINMTQYIVAYFIKFLSKETLEEFRFTIVSVKIYQAV